MEAAKFFVVACIQAVWVRYRLARGFGPSLMSRRPRAFQALARTLWAAPEGSRASRIALRTARLAAENPFALRELLGEFHLEATGRSNSWNLPGVGRYRPTPPPVNVFLFEPVESAGQEPRMRVEAFLLAPAPPLPSPSTGTHDALAGWLIHAAMLEEESDPPEGDGFGTLSGLLARTDDPRLLSALSEQFSAGISSGKSGPGDERWPYPLWRDGAPTLLNRMVKANPHLPVLPAPPEGGPPWYCEAPAVLLVLLKERPDQVAHVVRCLGPHGVVASLERGLGLQAPPEFTEACRQALRRLEDPVARDDVCKGALFREEMRAAAVDAGYIPSAFDDSRKAAFLFATEQWERYDAADPHGTLLARFCNSRPDDDAGSDNWWWELRTAIRSAAQRSGRPDPLPKPRTTSPPTYRAQGPVGSWPTSYTGDIGGFHGI